MFRCIKEGFSDEELFEAFNVALVAIGSITIPRIRPAVDVLDQRREKQRKGQLLEVNLKK
jgi:hypothetical protein